MAAAKQRLVSSASRVVMAALTRHWNRNGQLSRHAVLVGGGAPAGALLSALDASQPNDVDVVGIFDDRDDRACGSVKVRVGD